MKRAPANEFRHTTAPHCPDAKAAIVFLDEEPGIVGIYLMDESFLLWPARTVDLSASQDHVETVLGAWGCKREALIDARGVGAISQDGLRARLKEVDGV